MVEKSKKTRLSVTITQVDVDALAELIDLGLYLDNQSAIREFIRDGFRKHNVGPFKSKREPKTIEREKP